MGDTVNVAARLMGKAQTNEINCDLETKSLCDHVMEFRALPPVKTKGKQHLVPVFQPTGRMKRQAVLQTTTGEPISTWPAWKYKNRVSKLFLPGYEYRKPILGLDRPPLDFPLSCGALFPWEYIEPWLPSLRPTIYLGGVAVIVGKETDGTTELVQRVAELAQQLGRSHFLCSNMPDSTYVNIANVPLLAWRKLCTEMVETWRWSPARERKGFSKVDRDNSMYGLSKELIHPIFHWRLHEMKPVIHGLVLPYEVPQNQVAGREQLRGTGKKGNRKKIDRLLRKASNFVASLKGEELSDEGLGVRHSLSEEAENGFMGFQASSPHMSPQLPGMTEEEQSLAPVICSLVNGFSMFEPCIVCLHVRSGTSLFASMDSESWKVARLVGRIAMMRRRRKIELDTKELKRWRRQHSRDCIWCRGTAQPYKGLKGEIYHPKWTTWCKPPESRYFPPFLFVLVCSDTTSHISEQQELVQWGRECNCLIEMKRMSPVETGSYLGHCLSVPRKNVPDDLIEYVCRISAGIPKYIYLTARQLIVEQAIVVDTASKDLEDEWDRYRDSEGRHPFDSFVREADPNSSTKVSLNNEDNKAGSKDSASFSKGASQGSKKFSRLRHHWSHGSFTSHAVATSQRTRRLAVGSRTPENPAAVLKSNHMGAGEGELVSSAGVQPALSVAEPDTRDEERRILHESFFSHALTGKTNIPEDATTSDADSECSTERFKTNSASQVLDNTPPLLSATAITPARPRCKQRKKVITVYSFDHHMELLPDAAARTAPSGTGLPDLDISVSSRMRKKRKSRLSLAGTFLSSGVASPAPTPRSASHQRLRSLGSQGSGTRSTRDSLLGFSGLLRKDDGSNTSRRGSLKQKVDVQPSTDILSIDELRVSQVHCVDPSVDLNCLGDYYVVKTAGPQSLQSPAVYVKQAEALQAEREAQRLEAFHGAFGEAIQNAESLAQKKYEEPLMHTFGENLVRSVASEEPANTIDKRKPVEETCSLGSLAPTDTRTSLKGVDFYHPGVPAPFVPPGPDVFASRLAQHAFAPALETSCQTRYEREKENQQRESVKSTAEEAAEEIRAKEKLQRNRCVYVIKDLKKVPFVSELRAAAMSLMERLEPDEQLAAKVASVFPVAFTWFEVQAVYPRPMSPRSFQQMIENLIAKEMLESCEPPSQPQLEELDLLPLQRGEKRESVNGPGTSNDKYTPFLNWNQEKGDYPESLNPPDDDNSTKKMRSVATEEFSGSNESTVEESLVTELALPANRWGFDDDGNPIFYRFTSIAFQHVVADLLMSQEREFLARVSRKVICFRRTYGLEFLIQQIHAKPVDKSIIGGLGDQQETAQDALYSLSWNPTVEDIPKDSAYPVSVHPLQSMKTPFKLSQSMLTRHSSGNQQNTNTKMIDTNNKTLPTDSFRPYNDACTRSMVNTPDADTLTTLGDRHDSAKGTTSNSTD